MRPVPDGWQRVEETRSGHFGACDACGVWLDGMSVTFVNHVRNWDGAKRYYCVSCDERP